MKIAVLGTGLVGSAIVQDLAEDHRFQILGADLRQEALKKISQFPSVSTREADLSDPRKVAELIKDADLVVSAVPGFLGYQTLESVIRAGKNVVDISFFNQDAFELDGLAREKGVTAIVDCGVAPGLCNIIAGYASAALDRTDSYLCLVGGLPQKREWPYEYKAVFSPADVIEEYVRPARFLENGQEVVYPALSEVELREFPGIGTLEAFNTDGLRSLRRTLDIPNMREKTMRYPGHAGLMRVFRESGFFDPNPIEVAGVQVRPLDLTSRLLFEQWAMKESEKDLTVMQVMLEGEQKGKRLTYSYYLVDHYDTVKKVTSMARTTGYTCAIAARLLLDGKVPFQGICPPEYLGQSEGLFQHFQSEYHKRGILLEETISRS
jgi:lysine 6-dehydrogenase